ncbi:MAG: class I SAM-dependent methyltransferase [Oscillospiraceae bacterium]
MAYNTFAYWYDRLNGEADYDKLSERIIAILRENGIDNGIVADLGCGTGELALLLAEAGYDLIGVDGSADMLCVFRDKAMVAGRGQDILILCQKLETLDLYGTIRAAVSSFDTFNHLDKAALESAIGRVALFLEPGGMLLFDVNTPYKHEQVLGNNTFQTKLEDGKSTFLWQNHYDPERGACEISIRLKESGVVKFSETFWEYSHPLPFLEDLLARKGLKLCRVEDGETFGPVRAESERLLIAARKE